MPDDVSVEKIDDGLYLIDGHGVELADALARVRAAAGLPDDVELTASRSWWAGPSVGFVPGMMSHLPDDREVEVRAVTAVAVG